MPPMPDVVCPASSSTTGDPEAGSSAAEAGLLDASSEASLSAVSEAGPSSGIGGAGSTKAGVAGVTEAGPARAFLASSIACSHGVVFCFRTCMSF